MFGPIGAAIGKKIAGGVIKSAVGNVVKTGIKQGATSRVASMVAGRGDGQSKGFRGTDMTEFRGY